MEIYNCKVFHTYRDLVEFLNNNSITKEEIISIITDGYGIALIYIAESEVENG